MNRNIVELRRRIWTHAMNLRNVFIYGEYQFPKMITLETQTVCNRKCFYCPNSIQPLPFAQMTEETFTAICRQMRDMRFKGKVVLSSFSEPLLDKRLTKFVKELKSAVPGCHPDIYTNGDYLTADKVIELIEAGAQYFHITKHPPYSEEWDQKVARLIKYFPRHIESRGTLLRAHWRFNMGGTVPNPPNACKWVRCDSILWNVTIYHNGDFPLCANLPTRKPIFGNLLQEDFLTIWRKPEFVAARKQALTPHPTLPVCQRCFDRTPSPVPAEYENVADD